MTAAIGDIRMVLGDVAGTGERHCLHQHLVMVCIVMVRAKGRAK